MSIEHDIVYERTNFGEEALVLHEGLKNLRHPKLLEILQKIDNFPPELLRQLLMLDFTPTTGPTHEAFSEGEVKFEDLTIRKLNVPPYGDIEVSDVVPTQAYVDLVARSDGSDISLHLKHDVRGFEAILVLGGEAQLSFPKEVIPTGEGLYMRSDKGDDVSLVAGDLVIIPAPTANGWTKMGAEFTFRYIGLPPWSRDFVVKTD